MEYKDEELEVDQKSFVPSDKQVEVINRVFERFTSMQIERDLPKHYFDGRTLKEYVENSVDAYNGIVSQEVKDSKDTWQSITWDHKTRGKVNTTIAMIIGVRPFISITGSNEKYQEYADDMHKVYEDSWKEENGAYELFKQSFSACIKGTVIVEEYYFEQKRKTKKISSINQETGQVKFTEKDEIVGKYGKVKSKTISILDFYPNENSAEIEHDCCVVNRYTKKAFNNRFGKYANAQHVMAGVWGSDFVDSKYVSITTKQDELVEVINYYNEDWDEFIILANGVWINPQYGDKEGPIPYNHKKLPFTKTVFEMADEEAFWGKSLPDLMRGEQDPTNALTRLMIDQEILAVNKPIFLGGGVELESMELYPGATKKVTGDVSQIKEADISGANQSGFQMLQLLKNNADVNTAIDPTSQGVHSGRKTAQEANILDENSKRNSGPFQLHIYKLLIDRAKLRVPNIKQFYTKPIQYSILEDKYGPVTDSEGKKIEKAPQYREITIREPGKEPMWLTIDPAMKNAEFNLEFIEDYEVSNSKGERLAIARERLAEAKANPLLNADACTIDFLVNSRSNPDKFYIKPTPEANKFANESGLPAENASQRPQI